MKKRVLIALVVVLALAATASVVWAKSTKVVTPALVDHEGEETCFDAAFGILTTGETILGDNSAEMYIPQNCIPAGVYNLGVNAEVTGPGIASGLGLSRYDGISFKAKEGTEGRHGALNVSLILYDRTSDVWVSMLTYNTACTGPSTGWQTCTAPAGAGWDAWTFGGVRWPVGNWPGYISLEAWDDFIAANDLNVKVKKVNIQFGYDPNAWGTVYVDGLELHGKILDFEPEP